jgi:hypothetical protein
MPARIQHKKIAADRTNVNPKAQRPRPYYLSGPHRIGTTPSQCLHNILLPSGQNVKAPIAAIKHKIIIKITPFSNPKTDITNSVPTQPKSHNLIENK